MILPIYAYGQPVLKKVAVDIDKDYPDLPQLIENMWETMYHAEGIGLAAPQIGLSIRIFMIDTTQLKSQEEAGTGVKKVFINAHKVEEAGEPEGYEEGCLSIPDVRGNVDRPSQLRLRYLDENFEEQEEVFTGFTARVIQHEYDHIDGVLFVQHLKPVKRQLVRRKLEKIKQGKINPDYKMKFVAKR
ncbi:MAG: peptide deformylase [Bacteroidota bacterium]